MGEFAYGILEGGQGDSLVKGFLHAPVRALIWRGGEAWSEFGLPLADLAQRCRLRIIADEEATCFMATRRVA